MSSITNTISNIHVTWLTTDYNSSSRGPDDSLLNSLGSHTALHTNEMGGEGRKGKEREGEETREGGRKGNREGGRKVGREGEREREREH